MSGKRYALATTTRRTFLHTTAAAFGAGLIQVPGAGGTRAGEPRVIEGVPFRWCPAGRFVMGSPPDEPGRRPDEAQVEVALTRGFWMSQTEVTQGQWHRLVGPWPDRPPTAAFGLGDDYGMYWVNYVEAEQFCERLTSAARRTGGLPSNWQVRLPTEAQWEYACRAGTTTAMAFGPTLDRSQANIATVPHVPGTAASPLNHGVPVGSYPPNAWGLCDMHGNLFEWCRDWYHARLPGGIDPEAIERGAPNGDGSYSRVRRGGAWTDEPQYCRSAMRLRYESERRSDHIGFRVVAVQA